MENQSLDAVFASAALGCTADGPACCPVSRAARTQARTPAGTPNAPNTRTSTAAARATGSGAAERCTGCGSGRRYGGCG